MNYRVYVYANQDLLADTSIAFNAQVSISESYSPYVQFQRDLSFSGNEDWVYRFYAELIITNTLLDFASNKFKINIERDRNLYYEGTTLGIDNAIYGNIQYGPEGSFTNKEYSQISNYTNRMEIDNIDKIEGTNENTVYMQVAYKDTTGNYMRIRDLVVDNPALIGSFIINRLDDGYSYSIEFDGEIQDMFFYNEIGIAVSFELRDPLLGYFSVNTSFVFNGSTTWYGLVSSTNIYTSHNFDIDDGVFNLYSENFPLVIKDGYYIDLKSVYIRNQPHYYWTYNGGTKHEFYLDTKPAWRYYIAGRFMPDLSLATGGGDLIEIYIEDTVIAKIYVKYTPDSQAALTDDTMSDDTI